MIPGRGFRKFRCFELGLVEGTGLQVGVIGGDDRGWVITLSVVRGNYVLCTPSEYRRWETRLGSLATVQS